MLVRDGSLAAAIGTLGGVCLLRCGPLWSRALDLARPTLAQAPDSKRGALCIQRCLESAARDLLPEEEDEEERLRAWRAFESARAGPRARASPTPRPSSKPWASGARRPRL